MPKPEFVRTSKNLFAKLRELPYAIEVWKIDKPRANEAALALTELLLQIPYDPDGLIHRASVARPGDMQLTALLYDTGNTKTLPALIAAARPHDRLEVWERDAKNVLRVNIEYLVATKTGFPIQGLNRYEYKNSSGESIIEVHQAHQSENGFIATEYGRRVPFDAKLQSQVYCEIAMLFIAARQTIEKLPSTG